MVISYPPARLRYNSDRPTAITNVLVATSGSSSRTGEIPLGTPTCSARSRSGRWVLYPSGEEVVVVWPGGVLMGLPGEVAGELDRLGGGHLDELDRGAVWAIRQFLTDPVAADAAPWLASRARIWSAPRWATGSAVPPTSPAATPTRRPTGLVHQPRSRRSGCPTQARSRHQHEPPDRSPTPQASSATSTAGQRPGSPG
jgi:hypothetical protein